jgi:hypothetical protein
MFIDFEWVAVGIFIGIPYHTHGTEQFVSAFPALRKIFFTNISQEFYFGRMFPNLHQTFLFQIA